MSDLRLFYANVSLFSFFYKSMVSSHYSYLIIIIRLPTIILFHIFLSNATNLHTGSVSKGNEEMTPQSDAV